MSIDTSNIHSDFVGAYKAIIETKRKNAFISELKGRFKIQEFENIDLAHYFKSTATNNGNYQLSLSENGIQFTRNNALSYTDYIDAHRMAHALRPWKKGPFHINNLTIDGEWDTQLKLDRLQRALPDIANRRILDIGCNNGYFLFAAHALRAEMAIGIDPSFRPYFQYLFLKSLVPNLNNIQFYWLGIEHMHFLTHSINTILCMGILYHRPSSKKCLEDLYHQMNKGDVLILETIVLSTEKKDCLYPKDRYQKMSNVYEIPSVPLLKDWITDAGFQLEYVDPIQKTTSIEQRSTYLGVSQSLDSFLDPSNPEKTIEGYPAPYRVMMRLEK